MHSKTSIWRDFVAGEWVVQPSLVIHPDERMYCSSFAEVD